jgi:hypothetical protein
MDRGNAMQGFLISIIFTPLILLLIRFSVKKLKNSKRPYIVGSTCINSVDMPGK